MKLKHLAITAFALSMSAVMADGMKSDKEKAANGAAPAGYADKSAAAEPMTGQKDTKKAQKKAKKQAQADAGMTADAGIVVAEAPANPNAPAGYADKSTNPENKAQPKDTEAGQAQPDSGIGSMAAAPAQPGAPAGYSDQAAAQKPAEPQDTQKAQEQSK